MIRLQKDFFCRDVLDVAPEILGKKLVLENNGIKKSFVITEVEAYRGEEDLACHASKGRTKRTEIMYMEGGVLYVYLIYGMYWMLNIVTSVNDNPQAILIRGVDKYDGPGKLTKALNINGEYNGEDICKSERIWVENGNIIRPQIHKAARIGIEYAGSVWKNKKWRFYIE